MDWRCSAAERWFFLPAMVSQDVEGEKWALFATGRQWLAWRGVSQGLLKYFCGILLCGLHMTSAFTMLQVIPHLRNPFMWALVEFHDSSHRLQHVGTLVWHTQSSELDGKFDMTGPSRTCLRYPLALLVTRASQQRLTPKKHNCNNAEPTDSPWDCFSKSAEKVAGRICVP